jgi:stearoyl-CoA desaturase (delta-9 desaturase)
MPAVHPVSEVVGPVPVPERAPLGVRMATLAAIVLPVLGLGGAAAFLWGRGFSWVDLGLLLGMYLLTALGITAGFHRLFVHRSFETYMPVKVVFAVLGSMAVQGDLITWVGVHRRHHQHSDTPDDPHTPHHHGPGLLGWLKGYWHAHIGWFFDPTPADLERYVKDLRQSPTLRGVSGLFPLWVALGLVFPAVLGGVISGSWTGAWSGLVWGGLVRVFLVHHVTWSVNSACHLWGLRPYASDDLSRDNVVFGILALGEGWHNTHHAFPTSARHGLGWWQPDVSYYVIRGLWLVGLAWNVKLPSKQARADKRRRSGGPPVDTT